MDQESKDIDQEMRGRGKNVFWNYSELMRPSSDPKGSLKNERFQEMPVEELERFLRS